MGQGGWFRGRWRFEALIYNEGTTQEKVGFARRESGRGARRISRRRKRRRRTYPCCCSLTRARHTCELGHHGLLSTGLLARHRVAGGAISRGRLCTVRPRLEGPQRDELSG